MPNCDNCQNQDPKDRRRCSVYGLCYHLTHTDYTGVFCEHLILKEVADENTKASRHTTP